MANDQEEFWKGDFGDDYNVRNQGMITSNVIFFSKILPSMGRLESALEFGCGTGQNLDALNCLTPATELSGIEINEQAFEENQTGLVHNLSIFDPRIYALGLYDLVFTKGLLIHVHPDDLEEAYDRIYLCSNRYILFCEYYNPSPVEIDYRGHGSKMWKRDFAGEMMDMWPDLKLIDYGFAYHRDHYPQDDLTWFLMEKTK